MFESVLSLRKNNYMCPVSFNYELTNMLILCEIEKWYLIVLTMVYCMLGCSHRNVWGSLSKMCLDKVILSLNFRSYIGSWEALASFYVLIMIYL